MKNIRNFYLHRPIALNKFNCNTPDVIVIRLGVVHAIPPSSRLAQYLICQSSHQDNGLRHPRGRGSPMRVTSQGTGITHAYDVTGVPYLTERVTSRGEDNPAGCRRRPDVGSMVGRRRGRYFVIEPMFGGCVWREILCVWRGRQSGAPPPPPPSTGALNQCWTNADWMLVQGLRRWTSIKPPLHQCLVWRWSGEMSPITHRETGVLQF